jgi:hypothetical protein
MRYLANNEISNKFKTIPKKIIIIKLMGGPKNIFLSAQKIKVMLEVSSKARFKVEASAKFGSFFFLRKNAEFSSQRLLLFNNDHQLI